MNLIMKTIAGMRTKDQDIDSKDVLGGQGGGVAKCIWVFTNRNWIHTPANWNWTGG